VKELKQINDYIKAQGRFRHLKDADIEHIQKQVTENYKKLLAKFKQDRK